MARFAVACGLNYSGSTDHPARSGAPSIVTDVVGQQQASTSTWTAVKAAIAALEAAIAALLATTAVQGDNTTKTSVTLGQTDFHTYQQDFAQGASLTTIQASIETLVNTTWPANAVITGDTTADADLVIVQADWTTVKAAMTAFVVGVAAVPSTSDVVVSVNASTVLTVSALRTIFNKIDKFVQGNNALTP
jgi:hypothetical protein